MECTVYDFKVMHEEKKSKSWLKSVSGFANGLGGSLFFSIDNEGTIFAFTDTPNVGDHNGDISETLSVSQRTIERDLSAM